jgi:hypothetical protein
VLLSTCLLAHVPHLYNTLSRLWCIAKTRSNAGPGASLCHCCAGRSCRWASMQYARRLAFVCPLRRRSWLSRILRLSCTIWTELKDGHRTSRRTALTGSRTYVAFIVCVEASSLTILPSRSFSRPIRHMEHTPKAFVACGAYAERRIEYPLPAKYR